MTIDEIRAAIAADPALRELMPDTSAIADALSAGRVRVVQRLGGIGLVMDTLGPDGGAAVLDGLETLKATHSAVKWAWYLIERGELDFGSPATRGMIELLLPEPARSALLAVAEEPAPVPEMLVRIAVYHDDGSLAV